MDRKLWRNIAICAILLWTVFISFYVSQPDYPKDAEAWEIFLWGEPSQWWSEMTWILGFAVFSSLALIYADWSKDLPISPDLKFERDVIRILLSISLILLIFDFSIVFFRWNGFWETFALDTGGWLHGVYYIITLLVGISFINEFLCFQRQLVEYLK